MTRRVAIILFEAALGLVGSVCAPVCVLATFRAADDIPSPRVATGDEAVLWQQFAEIKDKIRSYRLSADQACSELSALAVKSKGTALEPYARLTLSTTLFTACEYAHALAELESIRKDFPNHYLCQPQATLGSLIDQDIELCRSQVEWLKGHPIDLSRPKPDDDEVAIVETSEGSFKIGFFKAFAPKHVERFKELANNHKFDGTYVFHVFPDFWVRMGDLQATDPNDKSLWGASEMPDTLAPEPSKLLCIRGSVLQERPFGPNTQGLPDHGSQFNLCLANPSFLDGVSTVFGEIIEGLDVVESISRIPYDPLKLTPQRDVQVKSVTIAHR
ncbi:MAG: peptidylprolyl isomerase [Planctomycetes bacterium]|nr:peptidylprolyl isomerase [Planctomycetota bacterium]MBI3844670.1 peptidylprolyl isomerase [Planctomycetota bacterium]